MIGAQEHMLVFSARFLKRIIALQPIINFGDNLIIFSSQARMTISVLCFLVSSDDNAVSSDDSALFPRMTMLFSAIISVRFI